MHGLGSKPLCCLGFGYGIQIGGFTESVVSAEGDRGAQTLPRSNPPKPCRRRGTALSGLPS